MNFQSYFFNYFKFALIGLLRAILFFLIYIYLIKFFYPLLVVIFNWFISIPVTIFLHKNFIFNEARFNFNDLLKKYGLIYINSLIINLVFLFTMLELLNMNPIFSQFLIIVLLSIINFIQIKRLYK